MSTNQPLNPETPQIPPVCYPNPVYTMSWLGLRTMFILGVSLVLALITNAIDGFASDRVEAGLLQGGRYDLLSHSLTYCFCVMAITLMTIVIAEVGFRKIVNLLQYALTGMALALFYLILLALSEKLPFAASYIIVSVMTIGLIALYIKGITGIRKAVVLITAILVAEYALMFVLIKLGSMALLVGSLSLFAILAVAMYFTLKLKMKNGELTLEK